MANFTSNRGFSSFGNRNGNTGNTGNIGNIGERMKPTIIEEHAILSSWLSKYTNSENRKCVRTIKWGDSGREQLDIRIWYDDPNTGEEMAGKGVGLSDMDALILAKVLYKLGYFDRLDELQDSEE